MEEHVRYYIYHQDGVTRDEMEEGRKTYISTSLNTVSEETDALGTVVLGGAFVELVKVDGVLERAILDQAALGDLIVVLGQTHSEAKEDLGIGVQLLGAKLDDVSEA